jgi:uncharacterized protein
MKEAQMRASSYVIYVDLPDNPDEMLLVHGYTGAFDKVSRPVATFVRSLELRHPPKPLYGAWVSEPVIDGAAAPPSDETLKILRRRGYITEMTCEKEQEAFQRIASAMHQVNCRRISYVFMPTYDCNLRCAYCFQDHMRSNQQFHHLLQHMSPEILERIFCGVKSIEAAHGYDGSTNIHRNIGFFGGEPLLAANRPIIDHILQYFSGLGTASFWAISNATELEAYKNILSPEKISRVQVTIDGPPAEHDKRRIYPDGSGSFEKIAGNIQMALEHGVQIAVRLNVDQRNLPQLPEIAGIISRHGWDKYPNFGVYTSPIRASNENVVPRDTMGAWEVDKAVATMQREHPLMSVIAQPDDAIKHQARRIFRDPEHGLPMLRESFCGAHTGMYVFDTFCDIYACWERTGDPSLRIGHVHENGKLEMNLPNFQHWRSRTVLSSPVCSKCRYALHCGGGCAVLAERRTGEFHMNYCDGFSTRFRANVAEAYLDHIAGRPMVERGGPSCDQ